MAPTTTPTIATTFAAAVCTGPAPLDLELAAAAEELDDAALADVAVCIAGAWEELENAW